MIRLLQSQPTRLATNVSYMSKSASKLLKTRAEKLEYKSDQNEQQDSESELKLYKNKLSSYFAFPEMMGSDIEGTGSITLKLETLLSLFGNGIF